MRAAGWDGDKIPEVQLTREEYEATNTEALRRASQNSSTLAGVVPRAGGGGDLDEGRPLIRSAPLASTPFNLRGGKGAVHPIDLPPVTRVQEAREGEGGVEMTEVESAEERSEA